MGQNHGLLTPEERARITELQDVLIERFVEHAEAIADGQEARAKELRVEIDGSCVKRKRSRSGRQQGRPSHPPRDRPVRCSPARGSRFLEVLHRVAQDYDDIAEDLEGGAIEIRHPELMPQRR
jgi:hypothetical protein